MDLLGGYGSSSEEAAPQQQEAPAGGASCMAGVTRLPDAAQLFADAPGPRLAATGCVPPSALCLEAHRAAR
jgi:hypothetical protein